MHQSREFTAPLRALLRAVPDTFAACVREQTVEIDGARARQQHAGYRQLLSDLGVSTEVVPADAAHPDCCFVEDTTVLMDDHALATVPGCASRRGEVAGVREHLPPGYQVCSVADVGGPGATLDGGDVMRAGEVLFVGRSERSNAAGIEALSTVATRDGLRVVPIAMAEGLHLKSVVTLLDPGRVLYRDGSLDTKPLLAAGLQCVAVPEPHGANVLAFGRDVVVSEAAPRTAELVNGLGFHVHAVEVGEFHKGDAGLTCLSLRIPPDRSWCV